MPFICVKDLHTRSWGPFGHQPYPAPELGEIQIESGERALLGLAAMVPPYQKVKVLAMSQALGTMATSRCAPPLDEPCHHSHPHFFISSPVTYTSNRLLILSSASYLIE